MVSKLAVTAIVVLVAAPILLGYATAFGDVEHVKYNEESSKNVTDLLYNSTDHTYTYANSYVLNSAVWASSNGSSNSVERLYPIYRTITENYTSLPIGVSDSVASSYTLSGYSYLYIKTDVTEYSSTNRLGMTIYRTDNTSNTYDSVKSVVLDGPGKLGIISYNNNGTAFSQPSNVQSISFNTSNFTGNVSVYYLNADGTGNKYADFIDGYNIYNIHNFSHTYWNAGIYSSEIVATVDLNNLSTSGNATVYSVSSWDDNGSTMVPYSRLNITRSGTGASAVFSINGTEMIRSDDSTKNVWQFIINRDGITANYVGSWPNQIGRAYAYQSIDVSAAVPDDIYSVAFYMLNPTSDERMRIDTATARSNPFPVISGQEYSPDLLDGSADGYRTVLSKTDMTGTSLTWAGTTYDVTDGKITVSNKRIPVDGLTLESVKQTDGTWLNTIDGTKFSVQTATLPTVTFNGSWSMIVQTAYLSKEVTVSTEWIPGEFAWNGADESFALIGLLTCGAVFVGLGMYGRHSGAKVGMLMLVTGCAAMIFLAMI